MPDTALERYERMKTSSSDMAKQWVNGFDEGWKAATERYLMRNEPAADRDDSTTWGREAA